MTFNKPLKNIHNLLLLSILRLTKIMYNDTIFNKMATVNRTDIFRLNAKDGKNITREINENN